MRFTRLQLVAAAALCADKVRCRGGTLAAPEVVDQSARVDQVLI